MAKRYDQYCPIAHALELVGERWSLLVVRELLHGPQRYTDLAASLPGIGTNILASRLKDLEGVRDRREAAPAAAGRVAGLRADAVRHVAAPADARARALGAEVDGPAAAGRRRAGLAGERARPRVLAGRRRRASFVFRIDGEVASVVDGQARVGAVEEPDAVLETDITSFYFLSWKTAGTA